VFGRRAALTAIGEPRRRPAAAPPPPLAGEPPAESTRRLLWEHAGLVRSAEGLARLVQDPHPLASLIGRAAHARRESRGCHVRSDFPATDPALDERHRVLTRTAEDRVERWD
jgi:L-aspartate oxidase